VQLPIRRTVVGSAKITITEGDYKFDHRLVRFEVAQTFRGELTVKAEIVTGWGGGNYGYSFNDGETYLVYASRNKENQRLYTSVCTRTRPISQASGDLDYIRNLPNMDAGAVIFGKVNKPNYKAKEGEAFSMPVSSANLIIEGESLRIEARTDEQGGYRITGLAPGAYTVKLKVPNGMISNGVRGGAMVEGKADVVERGCQQVDFYIVSDTRVSGRVVDAVGQPVADLPLEMRGAPSDIRNINTFLSARTNADGRFEFDGPAPPGDYLLGFRILGAPDGGTLPYPRTYYPGVAFKSQAGVISVKEGEHRSDIMLRLPPPLSEYIVQGFVVWSDGRPAPGAYIYLSLLEEGESSGAKTLQADERGHFTLKVYEGLNYKVSAYQRNATGAAQQSEWVEAPQTPDAKPIKLVLPVLKK
jgi:5-hydroxyisourate hydrolase-like protein (transthyretin family)